MAVLSAPQAKGGPDSRLSSISTSQLKPGVVLRQPIYAQDGVLLLAQGVEITRTAIERLIQRGISAVRVPRGELEWVAGQGVPRRSIARPVGGTDSAPLLKATANRGAVTYDRRTQQRLESSRSAAVSEVASVFRNCDIVRQGDLQTFEDMSTSSLAQFCEDPDLFLSPGVLSQGREYPAQQAVQSSSVALAIGARLGLDKTQLAHLGVGCLVHDLGMLRINVHSLSSGDASDPNVRLELMKHPSITFDLMGDIARQAGPARVIAYQIHERLDGSGFPRGREGNQIHPLARIAAVADTYARLISPVSGTAASSYEAIVHLLHGARGGLYDPQAVRGLLQSVSLFPIGTLVELTDGRLAQVLRANGEAYTRPVVEAWQPAAPASRELLDLLKTSGVQISRVIAEG